MASKSSAVAVVLLSVCCAYSAADEFKVVRLSSKSSRALSGRDGEAPICQGLAILRSEELRGPRLIGYPIVEGAVEPVELAVEELKDYQIQEYTAAGDLLCITGWKIEGAPVDRAREHAVFVYRVAEGGKVTLEEMLYPPDFEEADSYYSFGEPVKIDGGEIMVSELREGESGQEDRVRYYFYRQDGDGWRLSTTLETREHARMQRVPPITWRGDVLVKSESGEFAVYERTTGGDWKRACGIHPPLKHACTAEGAATASAAIKEGWIAVGEPSHDFGRGAVYLYQKEQGGDWSLVDSVTLHACEKQQESEGCGGLGFDCAFVGDSLAAKAYTGTYTSTAFLWSPHAKGGALSKATFPKPLADSLIESHVANAGGRLWCFYDSRWVKEADPAHDPAAATLAKVAREVVASDDPENYPVPKDPWGAELKIQVGSTSWEDKKWLAVEVKSAGPDGKFDSGASNSWDDLSVYASNWETPDIKYLPLQDTEFCGKWDVPASKQTLELTPEGSCTLTPAKKSGIGGDWIAFEYEGRVIAFCRFPTLNTNLVFQLLRAGSNRIRTETVTWPIDKPASFVNSSTVRLGNNSERGTEWIRIPQ